MTVHTIHVPGPPAPVLHRSRAGRPRLKAGELGQAEAADHIRAHFGERFLTPAGAGGWIVNQDVRDAVAALSGGRVRYTGAGPTGRWALGD